MSTYRVRSNTNPEKQLGSKRSAEVNPGHRYEFGVVAPLIFEDQLALTSLLHEAGKNIVGVAGYNDSKLISDEKLKVSESLAVAIAPYDLVGSEMHQHELTERQKARQKSYPTLVGKKPNTFFKSIRSDVAERIHTIGSTKIELSLEDVDWYEDDKSRLIAKFDQNTEGFETLQKIKERVLRIFGLYGLVNTAAYPADFIELIRFGTKNKPILFNDDVNRYARDLLRPALSGESITLSDGLMIVKDKRKTKKSPAREAKVVDLPAYTAWKTDRNDK